MTQALDNLYVVLCEPQDPINIGNAVRAMKNMGLTKLRLVRPVSVKPEHILISAPRGDDVVAAMEVFDSLDDALADVTFTVATTARGRSARLQAQRPREVAPALIAKAREGKVAILFGREDRGLANEDVDRAQMVLTVPTREDYSSINLGQAVLLVAYELFLEAGNPAPLKAPKRTFAPATASQLEGLFEQAEDALASIDFFKSGVREGAMRTLRGIFHRADLDAREVNMLRGVFVEVVAHVRRVEARAQRPDSTDTR